MSVYVAICHDRHIDVTIVLCETLETAKAECREWIGTKVHIVHEPYGNWLYYLETGDEEPWACVEKHEVKP